MLRTFVYILSTLAVVVASFGIFAMSNRAEEVGGYWAVDTPVIKRIAGASVWDNSTATAFSGSGTEASPYIIDTASKLAYMRNQVNNGTNYSGKYFRQTVDIDLNGGSSTVGKPSDTTTTGVKYPSASGSTQTNYNVGNSFTLNGTDNNGWPYTDTYTVTAKQTVSSGGTTTTNHPAETIGTYSGYAPYPGPTKLVDWSGSGPVLASGYTITVNSYSYTGRSMAAGAYINTATEITSSVYLVDLSAEDASDPYWIGDGSSGNSSGEEFVDYDFWLSSSTSEISCTVTVVRDAYTTTTTNPTTYRYTCTVTRSYGAKINYWTPIGTYVSSTRLFRGIYDGNGHDIINVAPSATTYRGLFGYLGAGAQVKNLHVEYIENFVLSGNYRYGGIAAYMAGTSASHVTITNCSVEDMYVSGSTSNIGGLASQTEYTDFIECSVDYLVIKNGSSSINCANVGGAVGQVSNPTTLSEVEVRHMTVYKRTNTGGTGGLVGYTSVNLTISDCRVRDCDLSAQGNVAYFGGFVGYTANGSSCNVSISQSVFKNSEMTYTGSSYNSYMGGAVGSVKSNFTLSKCYIDADLTLGRQYLGGLVGVMQGASSSNKVTISMTNNLVQGEIYAQTSSCSKYGGLVGYGGSYINTGSIFQNNIVNATFTRASTSSACYPLAPTITNVTMNASYNYYNAGKIAFSPSATTGTKTDTEIKTASQYSAWPNFNDNWVISSGVNHGYPFLSALIDMVTVTVTRSQTGSGSIATTIGGVSVSFTNNTSTGSYAPGSLLQFGVTAEEGYLIKSITVDGTPYAAADNQAMYAPSPIVLNTSGTHTIAVEFALQKDLTVNSGANTEYKSMASIANGTTLHYRSGYVAEYLVFASYQTTSVNHVARKRIESIYVNGVTYALNANATQTCGDYVTVNKTFSDLHYISSVNIAITMDVDITIAVNFKANYEVATSMQSVGADGTLTAVENNTNNRSYTITSQSGTDLTNVNICPEESAYPLTMTINNTDGFYGWVKDGQIFSQDVDAECEMSSDYSNYVALFATPYSVTFTSSVSNPILITHAKSGFTYAVTSGTLSLLPGEYKINASAINSITVYGTPLSAVDGVYTFTVSGNGTISIA